jgi:hypothetical protein
MSEIAEVFEKFDDEFLKFDRVPPERKLHPRPDLCAFLLLDRLVPGTSDMVAAAEHDEIWLEVSPEALAAVATEDDILTLIRCGLRYDGDVDSLAMFV